MNAPRSKDEGAGARDAGPLSANNTKCNCADSAAGVKRLANVIARFALAGYSVHPQADGSFIVARWDWTRTLPDLPSVEQMLKRVSP